MIKNVDVSETRQKWMRRLSFFLSFFLYWVDLIDFFYFHRTFFVLAKVWTKLLFFLLKVIRVEYENQLLNIFFHRPFFPLITFENLHRLMVISSRDGSFPTDLFWKHESIISAIYILVSQKNIVEQAHADYTHTHTHTHTKSFIFIKEHSSCYMQTGFIDIF